MIVICKACKTTFSLRRYRCELCPECGKYDTFRKATTTEQLIAATLGPKANQQINWKGTH